MTTLKIIILILVAIDVVAIGVWLYDKKHPFLKTSHGLKSFRCKLHKFDIVNVTSKMEAVEFVNHKGYTDVTRHHLREIPSVYPDMFQKCIMHFN